MRYTIEGAPLPVVTCELQAGEQMITEGGSMAWMTPNMQMETTSGGGAGKVLGRMFSGESLFLNRYTAQGGPGSITFASSLPGSIMPFQVSPGRDIVVQKTGFLAAEAGIDIVQVRGVKNIFFGGEGLFHTVLTGPGHIVLQSQPLIKFAALVRKLVPSGD